MLRTLLTKLLVSLVVSAIPLSWAVAASSPVGRIALTVGEAKRINAEGQTAPLRSGTTVSEGDRIITGGDAVAIIVFVDDGRISLRSDSELLVKQYKADPAGINSHLDFELVRGSIRQISGKAARMQPERYRLNTPIASIGVRGTDFLAKTSGDTLETFVQEGKIVVLSGAASCSGVSQTGNCAPLADIAATDSARYLKMFAGGKIERRAVASEEIERVFGISLVKATPAQSGVAAVQLALATPPSAVQKAADAPRPAETAPRDLPVPGLDTDKTHATPPQKLGDLIAAAPVSPVSPSPPIYIPPTPVDPVVVPPPVAPVVVPPPVAPVVVPPPVVIEPPTEVVQAPPPAVTPTPPETVVVAPTPPAPTPVPVPLPPALQNTPNLTRQLVWGRFDFADKLPLQLLATYGAATDGRTVTVGDLGNFALWRTPGATQSLPTTLKGEVQFDIHAGEAYLQQGAAMVPATISNPTLSVDFDRSRFTTSLTLSQAQTGDVALSASGKLDEVGHFLSVTSGQRVAGAVSYNGKEAGYWFSRDHALGVFKGVTLWNVR